MWWSWILTVIGVAGLYFAGGRHNRYGWTICCAAQFLWVAYALATHQYGFLVSAAAYGWVYARNLLRRLPAGGSWRVLWWHLIPTRQNRMRLALRAELQRELDHQILWGDGTAEPAGIVNTPPCTCPSEVVTPSDRDDTGQHLTNCCRSGAGMTSVLRHLDADLREHADRDKLTGVPRAVFLDRGGHAPGEPCPTAPPDDFHIYYCEHPDRECVCPPPPHGA